MLSRVMEIVTPLPGDTLLFHSLSAREELGRLFEYRIRVLSLESAVNPDELLGKNVTVHLELPDNTTRYFDGYVTRFGLVGVVGRYYSYEIVARPWLWMLTRTTDCRIFQEKKTPEIIKEIFNKYSCAVVDDKLTGSYTPWEYCVQYRETDFNFVSRLMEKEGIYYYFTHEDGKHTLVLADSSGAHEPFDGYASIPFIAHDRAARLDQEYITSWHFAREIQPGAFVLDDFDFKKPSTELKVNTQEQHPHDESKHEYYDYPGDYTAIGVGEHFVRTRMEEFQTGYQQGNGAGNPRGLAVGYRFSLTGHPRADQNIEYLVLSATYQLDYNEYEAAGDGGSDYHCSFTVMDSSRAFRTHSSTPKPHVQGPQTAIVVGPSGDEIYTDNYGRVKVQFHWDRYGQKNENASCWVRVSHPWAGKNYGMIAIPRMGQEVVVDFLEGDPDRPLITGRVYNAEQMPPYTLPANKTQTGIVTRSSKGGSAANANEIRFEDKKGAEHLLIHAEKDQMIEVENDETHTVGHDRTKTIDNDETTHVKHDRTETVDNNEKITIGVDRTEKVGGNEEITISGNRTEKVSGKEDITIGGNRTEKVMGNEDITITGSRVEKVTGNESLTITGAQTQTVTGGMTITTPASMNITAVAGINVTAPAGVNLLGGTQINGLTSSNSWVTILDKKVAAFGTKATGMNFEAKGVHIGQTGLQINTLLLKGEDVLFANSSKALNKVAAALQLSNIATKAYQGAVSLGKHALTIMS